MLPNTESALRVFGNGVLLVGKGTKAFKFYPFKAKSTTSTGNLLTNTPNLRVFVKSITLSWAKVAGDTGTEAYVSGTVNGESLKLASVITAASVAYQGSAYFDVGVLLDKETVPSLTAANFTGIDVQIVYASTDDTV